MLRRTVHLACLSLLVAAGAPALAQERGTKEEAIAMANAAFEHMKKAGAPKALADFTADKAVWNKKDLYVFVFDNKGTFLAHGANEKLVNRDMSLMKDANGKSIFPAMVETAAKGSGWVDYDWAHPQTKKVEGKSSYVRKTPDGQGLIGVGIYR
ncbi:cache domain-containing protein [Ideonella sp.]|uniref:cache domain-containing protein n=1 Tax=Ideonella sp. TaxID=1929293 RepID=UPI003BB7B03F